MENKLGLSEGKLFSVERKIVNLKMNLLDEYFTFNKNIFKLDYLDELHKFLFSDLYYDYQLEMRNFAIVEEQYIKLMLEVIKDFCINNPQKIEKILEPIENIWDLQPFYNGNTRTFLAYLSILNKAFLLDLDMDLNKEIESNPKMFRKENFVNQKRLTKN